MKTKIIIILMLSFCICSYAQHTPKDVMARVKVLNVPFNGSRTPVKGVLGSSIKVNDGVLSRKVYSNAQLTEWWDMKDHSDMSYYCNLQFDNPAHQNNYLLISLNDAGDFRTRILASVDPDGNINDFIDARITSASKYGTAAIMQYRITANGDVIISRIVPTSTTSIPLGDLKDFHGYRQDTTYRLDQNGKFQIINTVKFVPQLYTAQMISAQDYNVWNGNETPVE